jgi:hypothetical protein
MTGSFRIIARAVVRAVSISCQLPVTCNNLSDKLYSSKETRSFLRMVVIQGRTFKRANNKCRESAAGWCYKSVYFAVLLEKA